MSEILYLKKAKDIEAYGHDYDEYCFLLDSSQRIDITHPERKMQTIKKIGDGIIVKDFNQFEEAGLKSETYFGTENGEETLFTERRKAFLMNWVYTTDEVYCYKNDSVNFGRMRVYPTGKSKEKLKNFIYTDFDLNFECSDSFFESIDITTQSFSKTTETYECLISNPGMSTSFIFKITITEATDSLFFRLYENLGIQISNPISAGSTISVNTRNMEILINNTKRELDISGTPFKLEPGENKLKVTCVSEGEIQIQFYERFI